MKKIDPNKGLCENYELDTVPYSDAIKKGASIREFCGSCLFNIFTYCHFEDRKDPIVIRALQGNHEARYEILEKVRRSGGTQT